VSLGLQRSAGAVVWGGSGGRGDKEAKSAEEAGLPGNVLNYSHAKW